MQEQKHDCHRLEKLDKLLGKRVILTTTKGKCRGHLDYMDGWYFCNAGERWQHNQWVQCPYRFLFRKGQLKKVEVAVAEKRCGL